MTEDNQITLAIRPHCPPWSKQIILLFTTAYARLTDSLASEGWCGNRFMGDSSWSCEFHDRDLTKHYRLLGTQRQSSPNLTSLRTIGFTPIRRWLWMNVPLLLLTAPAQSCVFTHGRPGIKISSKGSLSASFLHVSAVLEMWEGKLLIKTPQRGLGGCKESSVNWTQYLLTTVPR